MTEMRDVFAWIEDDRFAAAANVGSRLESVLTVIRQDPLIAEFGSTMAERASRRVLERTRRLSSAEFDLQYEHPYDVALVCYLWILAGFDLELGRVAARLVLKAPNLWWGRKYAAQLTIPTSVKSHSTNVETLGSHKNTASSMVVMESVFQALERDIPVDITAERSATKIVHKEVFGRVLTNTGSSTQLRYAS